MSDAEAFRAIAQQTDQRVRAALDGLGEKYPNNPEAVISGAMAALVRFYVETRMNRGDLFGPGDVNRALFPLVNATADMLLAPPPGAAAPAEPGLQRTTN